MKKSSHSSAFVGFGQSPVSRHDDVPLGDLALQACRTAIADAGLSSWEIDGVACVPEPPFAYEGGATDGLHYVSSSFIIQALQLDIKWNIDNEGMLGSCAVDAIKAVESGQCNYVLLFRALYSPTGSYGFTEREVATGPDQFVDPYGIFYPASLAGMAWHRYRDRYKSGTREQMATYVVQERANGLLYEGSYWYQHQPKGLSVSDYLSARIVSTPLSVNDCDLPIQGVGAFILTTAERAKDLPHPPAYIYGVGESDVPLTGIPIVTLDVQLANARSIGEALWADSGLAIGDVNVADLYDGFSMLTISWLEGLGFCGEGEAFDFIQEGRIALDGQLPVNPSGGNIGSGRLHGCNHLMDGILQVMGRSGPRQVSNAEIALVAIGPPHPTSPAILLGRHRL